MFNPGLPNVRYNLVRGGNFKYASLREFVDLGASNMGLVLGFMVLASFTGLDFGAGVCDECGGLQSLGSFGIGGCCGLWCDLGLISGIAPGSSGREPLIVSGCSFGWSTTGWGWASRR